MKNSILKNFKKFHGILPNEFKTRFYFVILSVFVFLAEGRWYMMSSIKSSIMDLRLRAPNFFSIDFLAITLRASFVNSSLTSSSSKSFLNCFIMAFLGSVRISIKSLLKGLENRLLALNLTYREKKLNQWI